MSARWASILPVAEGLVHGERGDTYGHPHRDYERTVAIFNAIAGRDLSVEEGVLFMVAVKLSRLANGLEEQLPVGRLHDTVVDTAGYLDCLWAVLTHDEETP